MFCRVSRPVCTCRGEGKGGRGRTDARTHLVRRLVRLVPGETGTDEPPRSVTEKLTASGPDHTLTQHTECRGAASERARKRRLWSHRRVRFAAEYRSPHVHVADDKSR